MVYVTEDRMQYVCNLTQYIESIVSFIKHKL